MDIYKIWDNYINTLKKYAVFKGRAGRAEYWWFVVANLIISIAVSILGEDVNNLYGILTFLPSLGAGIRRLHDVGKSGKFFLFILLPIVGWIILIVKLAKEGQSDHNKYGAVPAKI